MLCVMRSVMYKVNGLCLSCIPVLLVWRRRLYGFLISWSRATATTKKQSDVGVTTEVSGANWDDVVRDLGDST